MLLNEVLSKVTVSPSRPQGREAEVGAALALCHRSIELSGIEIKAAYSYKGTLCIELERGPSCKLEETHWPQLFQHICDTWQDVQPWECSLDVESEGWCESFIARPVGYGEIF